MFFLHTTLTKQFEYFSSLLTNEESGNSVWECTVIRKETFVEMFPLSLPFCSRFYALLSSAELLKGTKERAAALCFKMPLNGCWRAVRAAHILLWMATNKPEECTHPYTLTDGRGNCWILPGFCAPWTSCSPFSNAVPESTHTHTHTHTAHTQKQANTLQSLWVLDAMGNQSASYWFVQRKYDRPRLEWKQLTLTLRGFFKRAPHSSHWALVVCVVYRWIRMVMDVCAVLLSGCGRQRAVHIGWCQWGTHSIQHTHHILYQQLYTKALTHKYTWLKHTCTHTHTTLILLNGKCVYPKCLTVCILLTKMLTIHTQMAGSCRAGWWLV